jgi:hypothetical protein
VKERFGVAVEEGTTAKLRQLAGGERKIGSYLTAVVDWLWLNRENWERHELREFKAMLPEEIERRSVTFKVEAAEVVQIRQALARVERQAVENQQWFEEQAQKFNLPPPPVLEE